MIKDAVFFFIRDANAIIFTDNNQGVLLCCGGKPDFSDGYLMQR